jgi:hypothetical protein
MPGADRFAFRASHTDVMIDDNRGIAVFIQSPEGTEIGTGWIVAVHAMPGNEDFFSLHFNSLNHGPIVGGESVDHIPLF